MAHLLVVDDDECICALLAATLRIAGHAVVLARNGREAMERLEEHAVHLVITDMLMPQMDGLELIAALQKSRPHLPVIAMSGGAPQSHASLEHAQSLGAVRTLAKPFHPQQLVEAVTQALERVAH
jgi:DNA-binding NtrC family response regulator